MILLSLVGEQPIPNLIPLWQNAAIRSVQFVASETTLKVAENLAHVVKSD